MFQSLWLQHMINTLVFKGVSILDIGPLYLAKCLVGQETVLNGTKALFCGINWQGSKFEHWQFRRQLKISTFDAVRKLGLFYPNKNNIQIANWQYLILWNYSSEFVRVHFYKYYYQKYLKLVHNTWQMSGWSRNSTQWHENPFLWYKLTRQHIWALAI